MHQHVNALPPSGARFIVKDGAYRWVAVSLGGIGDQIDALLLRRNDGASCASGLPLRVRASDIVEAL